MVKAMGVLIITASQAFAYEFLATVEGTPVRWPAETASSGISWQVAGEAPAILQEALSSVTETWSLASCRKLQFVNSRNASIQVVWCAEGLHSGYPAQTILAAPGGVIAGATIQINAHDFAWSREIGSEGLYHNPRTLNLDAFLTHEMGHVLGLGHSDDPDKIIGETSRGDMPTMFCEVLPSARALHLDDIAGIRALYGVDIPLPELNVEYSITTRRHRAEAVFFSSIQDVPLKWDFGDGTAAESPRPMHRFVHAGMYSVTARYRGLSRTVQVEVSRRRVLPARNSLKNAGSVAP